MAYTDPGAFYGVNTILTICVYTGITYQMRTFENCYGLKKVIVYSPGQFENFTQIFYNCVNLRGVQFVQGVSCSNFNAMKFSNVFSGSSLENRNGWCDLDDRDPASSRLSSFYSSEAVISDFLTDSIDFTSTSSGLEGWIIALIIIIILLFILGIGLIAFFIMRKTYSSTLTAPLINFSTNSLDN